MNMKTQISNTENYFYELLKKKYHTSEVVREQITGIKEGIRERVVTETPKTFVARLKGQVIDSSFEKTLKIVAKRMFVKGQLNSIHTVKEQELVEATLVATLTEVESLIRYLKNPRLVLHCKKGVVKGASNLLIIDESERGRLGSFTPDYIHRNCVTHAETREQFTGRIRGHLVFNGLPLTSEKIGRELRFNKIETKNRVLTTAGLKEIYLNLHFISLVLKLDLEQHYLRLRGFNGQEDDLKMVEEKIDDLGFFSDVFNHITSPNNPLLFHKELFLDLMRLDHCVESGDWRSIPAYAGYIYSASDKVNGLFKLLEEFGLFLTYAQCIEKFITKLAKKLTKHKADISGERHNLTANYNELKKLHTISNHPVLKDHYQEILNSFGKLMAYLDFLTIPGTDAAQESGGKETASRNDAPSKGFTSMLKRCFGPFFGPVADVPSKAVLGQSQSETEEDVQKRVRKFHENLDALATLKTADGKDAFLEARKCVPQLTNLSDILDQLKELSKGIEGKGESKDPFAKIFAETNKFEALYKEIRDAGLLETEQGRQSVRGVLQDLQRLVFGRPLRESLFQEIINKATALENYVITDVGNYKAKGYTTGTATAKLRQMPIFQTITGIKIGLQRVLEKEAQNNRAEATPPEADFYSYSAKELDGFLARIQDVYGKLKKNRYYKNVSEFETMERVFDTLIEEVNEIDKQISLRTRGKDSIIAKEPGVHINYLKYTQVTRRNLEKAVFFLRMQIAQIEEFMRDVQVKLRQHSIIYSGVATSMLFDQIQGLLSRIDVKVIEMTESEVSMFKDSTDTILHYETGEPLPEPGKEDVEGLMKEIEKKTVVRQY